MAERRSTRLRTQDYRSVNGNGSQSSSGSRAEPSSSQRLVQSSSQDKTAELTQTSRIRPSQSSSESEAEPSTSQAFRGKRSSVNFSGLNNGESQKKHRRSGKENDCLTQESQESAHFNPDEPTKTIEEMACDTVIYFLLAQGKKIPIKRVDIIKSSLGGSNKSFASVMERVKDIFQEDFGIELVGLEPMKGKNSGYAKYILTSNYPSCVNTVPAEDIIDVQDTKRALLLNILAFSLLLRRAIEEDKIWQFYREIFDMTTLCSRREEFPKFLAQEYVAPLYLAVEEVKATDEKIIRKYQWGLRAEKEFTKQDVIQYVCQYFPNQFQHELATQFGIELPVRRNGNGEGTDDVDDDMALSDDEDHAYANLDV